jgi:hypothetical protein
MVILAGVVRRPDGANARGGWVRLKRKASDGLDAAIAGRAAACTGLTSAIRGDGSYYFLDLPPGDFEVSGNDECNDLIESRSVAIAAPGKRGIRCLESIRCLELHFDLTVPKTPAAEVPRRQSGRSGQILISSIGSKLRVTTQF